MAPREDADLKNAGDLRQPTLRLRVDVAAAGHAAVGVGIETVEKDVAATAGKKRLPIRRIFDGNFLRPESGRDA